MTILGLIAGACTTLSFLPQVVRTLQTRHASDLSAAWLMIFGLGTALWLTYGILKSDIAVALANGITFGLVMIADRRQVHDEAARPAGPRPGLIAAAARAAANSTALYRARG